MLLTTLLYIRLMVAIAAAVPALWLVVDTGYLLRVDYHLSSTFGDFLHCLAGHENRNEAAVELTTSAVLLLESFREYRLIRAARRLKN